MSAPGMYALHSRVMSVYVCSRRGLLGSLFELYDDWGPDGLLLLLLLLLLRAGSGGVTKGRKELLHLDIEKAAT